MALMSSTNNVLPTGSRSLLLEIAAQSIESGLNHGHALKVDPLNYPESLRLLRATFVTLKIFQRLRGCIGALEARLPLVADVAQHAYAAAFEDPRFHPLRGDEFSNLDIHISVLSPSESMRFSSEKDLLEQLRPGADGLILQCGIHRATFLPTVWDSLPDPIVFLSQLKKKAGLSVSFWSDDIDMRRYTTESF